MFPQYDETRRVDQLAPGRESIIGENVLHGLGHPNNLYAVRVKQVYGDKYRVNVYVRADAVTYKVAHSYFLETDPSGKILTSSPTITRLY